MAFEEYRPSTENFDVATPVPNRNFFLPEIRYGKRVYNLNVFPAETNSFGRLVRQNVRQEKFNIFVVFTSMNERKRALRSPKGELDGYLNLVESIERDLGEWQIGKICDLKVRVPELRSPTARQQK